MRGVPVISKLALILVLVLTPFGVMGISPKDRHAVIYDSVYYDDTVQAESCSIGSGLAELEGHKLPAYEGGTGYEQHLDVQGPKGDGGDEQKHYALTDVPAESQNGMAGGGGAFSTDDPQEEQYYVNMRWRTHKWAWSGSSQLNGSESTELDFYRNHPRILVTNPRTGKSVITAVVEAGPAPWTGTTEGSGADPSYWQGYVEGTPDGYSGRVAGLSPEAFHAIGAAQWVSGGSAGDKLLYSWAPDQTAEPGPTTVSGSAGGCPAVALECTKHVAFDGTAITPTAIVLHWTGGTESSAEDVVNSLKSNNNASVQLTILKDAKCYQLTDPLNTLTAHAAGVNDVAIGIEIVGVGEDELLGNQAQYEKVVSTVAGLLLQFNIEPVNDLTNKKGILGHFQTDPVYGLDNGKQDPGPDYLQKVIESVKEALNK